MGLFGSLIGWDQSMAAINALMAGYYIERASTSDRKAIANEVASIVSSVQRRGTRQTLLQRVSTENRIVQMNFIALACDNLHVSPPFTKCVWTRVKNPYLVGTQVKESHLSAAMDSILADDGVRLAWPGNHHQVDFVLMYEEGLCNRPAKDLPKTRPEKNLQKSHENGASKIVRTKAEGKTKKGKYEILHEYDDLVQSELVDTLQKVLHPGDIGSSMLELGRLFDQAILAKFVITGLETRLAAKATAAIFVFEEMARFSRELKEQERTLKNSGLQTQEMEEKLDQMAIHYLPIMERLTESGRVDKFMTNLKPRLQ